MSKASLLLLCLLTACSGNKMMNNDSAAKEIKEYFALDRRAMDAQIGRIGTNCTLSLADGTVMSIDRKPSTSPEVLALEALGYVSVTSDGPRFWKVALTEKGKTFARNTTPDSDSGKNGCDYQSVEFAVGGPELVRITGITADENAPQVEYEWKWKVTDLGRELRKDGKAYAALDPHQRVLLSKLLSLVKLHQLPIPMPPEDYVATDTIKFRRYTDGWRKE